jgi:hypothetical protein
METDIQSYEGGNDGEVVYFSGAKAEGTTHDHQWLKGYVAGKLEARLGMQTSQ